MLEKASSALKNQPDLRNHPLALFRFWPVLATTTEMIDTLTHFAWSGTRCIPWAIGIARTSYVIENVGIHVINIESDIKKLRKYMEVFLIY